MAYTDQDEDVVPINQDDDEARLRQLLGLAPGDPLPVAAPAAPAPDADTKQPDAKADSKTDEPKKDDGDKPSFSMLAPIMKADDPGASNMLAPQFAAQGEDGKQNLSVVPPIFNPDGGESTAAPAPDQAVAAPDSAKGGLGSIAAPGSAPGQTGLPGLTLSPQVQQAQQKLDALKADGSGVSHKHGFLGGLLKTLNVAGSILAPSVMAQIPGTTFNHNLQIHKAQDELNGATATQRQETNLAKDQADLNNKLNPPDKTKAPSIIRNPVSGMIEGLDKGDGTFVSPSSKDFPKELQDILAKETPKTKEGETALGDKSAQTNQILQNRYQVLHPGKTLPPEYSLTADSTQKDYDRVDKALEATERASGTKAQQDQANEFRKQTVALSQQNAALRTQKKTVEESGIEAAAQSLAKMDPNDLTSLKDIASMRGSDRLLIYNRAKEINPQFNTSEVNRKIKMMDNFTNGADGKSLQSFGTFLEHAGEASTVVDGIRNTSMPLINKPLNWFAKNAAGDPNYVRLLAALEPVKAEAENFMLNGHAMHVEDKKSIDAILSADSSPAQIQAAVKQLGHTVQARYNEMDNRYNGTMKQHLPPESLSDEARAGASKIGLNLEKAAAAGATANNVPGGVPPDATHVYRDPKTHQVVGYAQGGQYHALDK